MRPRFIRSGFLAAAGCLYAILLPAQEHVLEYISTGGGPGMVAIRSLVPADHGKAYAAGQYAGTFRWAGASVEGGYPYGGFISALEADGSAYWFLPFQSRKFTTFHGITVTKEETLLGIGTFSDTLFYPGGMLLPEKGMAGFMVETDTVGNLIRCFTLINELNGHFRNTLLLPDGSLIACGEFENNLKTGDITLKSRGRKDIMLMRLSPDGVILWIKQIGGRGNDTPAGLAATDSGFILAGNFSRDITLGDKQLHATGRSDFFIARMNEHGHILTSLHEGGRGTDRVTDMLIDSLGNCWYTGYFEREFHDQTAGGGKNFFLATRDSTGKVVRTVTAAGPFDENGASLALEAPQTVYLTLYAEGNLTLMDRSFTPTGKNRYILLAKFAGTDSLCWIKELEGAGDKVLYGLNTAPRGEVFLCGTFSGKMQIDDKTVVAEEETNVFLTRFFDPCQRRELELGPDRILCRGNTLTLAAEEGFAVYDWNNGAHDGKEWTIEEPGKYFLRTVCPYGCVYNDTIVVKEGWVDAATTVTDEIIPPGKNGSVCITPGGNFPPWSYMWSTGDTTSCVYHMEAGIYQVNVTDSAGCEISLDIEVETSTASGINLQADPNPFFDLTTVSYSIPTEETVELLLYDAHGTLRKILYRGKRLPGTYTLETDRENLPPGVYYIRLKAGNRILTRKIMITGTP
ncbi:MAG TPA: T9SS type A sorting domain-containing protein [Bacteroidetes bacterium]|nr:T9SS type A sorting domain-containing protein [Bacteroidota bacterium]